jgi:ATP-dependent protease ClpP protease subunit
MSKPAEPTLRYWAVNDGRAQRKQKQQAQMERVQRYIEEHADPDDYNAVAAAHWEITEAIEREERDERNRQTRAGLYQATFRKLESQRQEREAVLEEFQASAAAGFLASDREVPAEVQIEIEGVIDNALIDAVRQQLLTWPVASVLTVTINSIGGLAMGGVELHALIRNYNAATKRAVVSAACHSAALLPLLACDERLALPGASFMTHPTMGSTEQANKYVDLLYDEIAQARGVIGDQFSRLTEAGHVFGADVAQTIKLIHRVVEPVEPEQVTEQLARIDRMLDDEEEHQDEDLADKAARLVSDVDAARLVAMSKNPQTAIMGLPREYLEALRARFGSAE